MNLGGERFSVAFLNVMIERKDPLVGNPGIS